MSDPHLIFVVGREQPRVVASNLRGADGKPAPVITAPNAT